MLEMLFERVLANREFVRLVTREIRVEGRVAMPDIVAEEGWGLWLWMKICGVSLVCADDERRLKCGVDVGITMGSLRELRSFR